MKIAIIVEDVNRTGGQERVIAELVSRLALRHEIHLFCFSAADIPSNVIVHHLFPPPLRYFIVRSLWIVFMSWLAVRPRQYDIVLSQGGNAVHQTHALLHDCLARRWELTRKLYWRMQPPPRWKKLIQGLWFYLVARLERRAVKRCQNGRLIAVSHKLAELLSQYHDVPRDAIFVCENGVDHNVFHPHPQAPSRQHIRRQLGLREKDMLALFLGGRWLEKGVSYCVEALSYADDNVHLCVAGRDEPHALQSLAEKLGVAHRLHFLPPTPRPWEYYHAADVFVFPSHIEGFGLVAVEAAACGLPVLMTPVGVAERLIEEGISGFLLSHKPDEIAARLNLLARNPQLRRRMGEEAYQASWRFSWDRQAKEIEETLIKSIQAPGECTN